MSRQTKAMTESMGATEGGMSEGEVSDSELTWPRMYVLFSRRRDQMFALAFRHGLTPPHGFALSVLGNGPTRMRDLAEQMACDASYITAVVDRLEAEGFAERRADPNDRRVKEIALTVKGLSLAAEFQESMSTAPEEFEKLTKLEQVQFAQILAKLVPEVDGSVDPFRRPAGP